MALGGEGLRVLLVEDDKTCMFVTETMLKKFKYEVVAHRNPIEALKELREKNGEFDIVLTDIHMPAMNGLDLLAEIKKDYIKLPVVLMSVDGERDVIIDGINRGAALYFMKPLGMSQIKNLWQHTIEVVYPNKVIESLENALTLEDEDSSPEGVTDEEEDDSGSTNDEVNLEGKENDDQENEESVDEKEEQKDDETAAQKKQRMMWSPELHNKFLDAIESIGEERKNVVPKRILEVMNVPGLTRENVASHLQKYRIYVNKLKEEDRNIERSRVRSMAQSALGTPAFASNYPTALPNIQQALPQFSQPAQNVQSSILRDEYFQGSEVVPPLDQPNSTNNFRRHESSRAAADGETQSLNNAVLQGIHNLTSDVPTMQQTVPQQNDNGSSYDDLSYQLQQLSSINTNNFDGSSRMINPNPHSSGSLYTGPMPGDQSSNIPNTNINYIDRHVSARVGGVREPQVVSAPHETPIFSSDFTSQNEGYGDGFSDSNQFFQLPPFNNVATQPPSSNHSLPPLPESMPPLPSMVPLPPLSPLPPLPQQLELPTEQNGDGLLDELFNLEGFNTNAGTNLLPLLLDNDFDDTLFRNQDFPPPW